MEERRPESGEGIESVTTDVSKNAKWRRVTVSGCLTLAPVVLGVLVPIASRKVQTRK